MLAEKKKKPRKHKLKVEENEVPEKLSKICNENDIDDEDEDNKTEEEEEEELQLSKEFKIINFRKKLKESNFIMDLRNFNYLAETRPKFVSKYLEKKGKPFDMVEALGRIDKSNVYHVSYLCQGFQLILMDILTNNKTLMDAGVYSTKYFLKNYGYLVEKLLNSSAASHRKTALKLLTAFVCIDSTLGKQLMDLFNIIKSQITIQFTIPSKAEIYSNATETVRKCFIHFILAYLVEGNITLIHNFLDKYMLLKILINGLEYDDHITVCVVINALRKHVLESATITKTKKTRIFTEEILKGLLKLYEWKGPSFHSKKFKNATFVVNCDEQKVVRESIHEFLVVLLSSRKYGVVFNSMADIKGKRNIICQKALALNFAPWFDDLKADLVLNILKACPELARGSIKRAARELGKPSSNLNVTNYITKIISVMHPSVMKRGMYQMTLNNLSSWIKEIFLNLDVLLVIEGKNFLKSDQFEMRIAGVRLLLTMFEQYSNYMKEINNRNQTLPISCNDLRRFRFDIINHLLVNFPKVQNILLSLYLSIQAKKDPNVNVLEHLEITVDLVLLICQVHRSFVDKTGAVIDYIQLLRPLYESNPDKSSSVRIELKTVQLLLLLQPDSLKPSTDLFSEVVDSLINIFVNGNYKSQMEAARLLRGIFINTGLFPNGCLEIDIWIEALRYIESDTLSHIKKILIKYIKESKEMITKLDDMESGNDFEYERRNLFELFTNIENNVAIQGYIETPMLNKFLQLLVSEENVSSYLELVMFIMFHYLPSPKSLYKFYNEHFTAHKKYMLHWMTKKKPVKLSENRIPYFDKVYSSLLNGDMNFLDIFKTADDEEFVVFVIDGKEFQLQPILKNERIVMLYIYLIVFIASQLTQNNIFEKQHSDSCAHFLTKFLIILKDFTHQNGTVDFEEVQTEQETPLLLQAVKYLYCNHAKLLQNFNLFNNQQSEENFLKFFCLITKAVNDLEVHNIEEITVHFRKKIINQICSSTFGIIQQKSDANLTHIVDVLETFKLTTEELHEILKYLGTCSIDLFVLMDNNEPLTYVDVLIYTLERLTDFKKPITVDQTVTQISNLYIHMTNSLVNDVKLEKFEDALCNFLIVFHHCIGSVPTEVFINSLDNPKSTKATVRLVSLLLERRSDLDELFIAQIAEQISKKEIIYPLLNVLFGKDIELETNLLTIIYKEFRNGFMKTIDKPQKAGVIYKENVPATIYLINKCMPISECVDFCRKTLKVDIVEVFQLRAVEAIYGKALMANANNSQNYEKIFENFINSLLNFLSTTLKKDRLDYNKVSALSYSAYRWIKNYYRSNISNCREKILKLSSTWSAVYRSCLKIGMQTIEADEEFVDVISDEQNSWLLKILAYLCDFLYDDGGCDESASQIFEMITTHSRFFDIVLSQQFSYVKTELMYLMFVIVKKNATVLDAKHVPIFLGAYHAKLSRCDQYILALLQFYEANNIDMQQFRPFIWGESAINYYSIRDQENTTLNQEPWISDMMALIDRQVCEHTINKFPVWRKLCVQDQLPKVEFVDIDFDRLIVGNNQLERMVEAGITSFDSAFLKLCPKNEQFYDECYDPAFIIALMSYAFGPEVYSHPIAAVNNGLVGMVFSALSSNDKQMRLAAGCVQLRYRQHFENNKFLDKLVWTQVYDNIQNGLDMLRRSWMKNKRSSIPRVPYISAVFLAKSINMMVDPLNPLYKVLTMYMRVKDTFNFICVPEFNVLFYSFEVDHNLYRKFILEIIRDGIKCSSDLHLLITTNTFNVILGFYNSVMSRLEINLLIISIVSSCAKIPGSSKVLIEQIGIIPWINSVIDNIEHFHYDTIDGVIAMLNNLWYAIKACEKDFLNYTQIEGRLYYLLIKLAPNISGRISHKSFNKYVNLLNKTVHNNHKAFPEHLLEKIIESAYSYFENEIWYVQNIKTNGIKYIETEQSFKKRLQTSSSLDDASKFALISLRNFVSEWIR